MTKYWQGSILGDVFREDRPLCVPHGARPVIVVDLADWERLVKLALMSGIRGQLYRDEVDTLVARVREANDD